MSEASEVIATLPFVRDDPSGERRQFWNVTPTGDHMTDSALGSGFAVLAIETAMAIQGPHLIGWIIAEMGRKPEWRSVEVGFQSVVAKLACMAMGMARGNQACVCAALAVTRANQLSE